MCRGFYPVALQNELLTNGPTVLAFIADVQKANQYLSSKEVYKDWLVTMGSTAKSVYQFLCLWFCFCH